MEQTAQDASGLESDKMANGTVELTRNPTGVYLIGRITWSSTSNGTSANTSTVTATLQLQRDALNTTTGTFKGTFTVGSTSETISWYGSLPSKTWVTVKTITATVSHNSDGAGNCYLYALINGPGLTTMEGTYVSGSSSVTLDTIPRYASLKSVSDFTDEANPVISYSNPAGTAISSLQVCISLDGSTAKTAWKDVPKTGTEYTVSLTATERNTLRAATPNSNTLQVYYLLKTVLASGSNVASKPAKMNIVNADPVVSPVVVDTNSTTKTLTGDPSILVALHSTASVTINATAQKYATIKSKKVEHGTAVLTGDGTLSVTNNPIKITVTDSRGNETVKTAANTIVPYINPTCLIGNNIPEADGTFALEVSGLFYNGSIGKTANTLSVQYRRKAAGGSYSSWTTIGSVSKSGNSYAATANLTGLDYQTVYTFQARAIDKLNANGVHSAEKAVISEPVFDWGQYDFRFNVPVYDKTGAQIGNSETRWQNPPLILGTEYRTTEQWNGKPVYCKYINLGTLPNSTVKSINFTSEADSVVRPISVCGTYGTSESTQHMTLPSNSHNANLSHQVALTCVNYRQVRVITNFDASAFVGFATVKYWKTTD